jgi:serine/threonine protein phosphatase 1
MIKVAIGDVHGMLSLARRLLDDVNDYIAQHALGPAQVIFLGDFIDRGPQSRRVVQFLQSMEREGAIILRGNHEQMMIESKHSPMDWYGFIKAGGESTVESYKGFDKEFELDQRWMSGLPTSFEDDKRIFVHAGVDPEKSLDKQTDRERLWIRNKFIHYEGPFPKYVVHGHIIEQLTTPVIKENRCNVDTGACLGGALSAAFFNDDAIKPFHTISIAASVVPEERPSSIVTTLKGFWNKSFGKPNR